MSEYDRAVELCPAKQITLNRDNLTPAIIVYDLETAGFKREDDILQVHRILCYFLAVFFVSWLACFLMSPVGQIYVAISNDNDNMIITFWPHGQLKIKLYAKSKFCSSFTFRLQPLDTILQLKPVLDSSVSTLNQPAQYLSLHRKLTGCSFSVIVSVRRPMAEWCPCQQYLLGWHWTSLLSGY